MVKSVRGSGLRSQPIGSLTTPATKMDPRKTPNRYFSYIDISSIDTETKTVEGPTEVVGVDAPRRARQVVKPGDVLVSTVRPNLNAVAPITEQHRDRFYKVRRGDTLSKIARRFRVRERTLMSLNNLRSRHRIRVGQVIVLPDGAAGSKVVVTRQEPPSDGVYRIRRGDTISIIAKRFGVSQTALARENNLRNRHRISVGQKPEIRSALRQQHHSHHGRFRR